MGLIPSENLACEKQQEKKENWRKPDLSQNEDVHVVELKLWMTSLMPDECIEYLHGLFGSSYMQLDREEQLILGTAYLEGSVTNVRIQTMLKRNGVEVGHILAKLVDKGMLIADKRGRWTSYTLNAEYESHGEQHGTVNVSQQMLIFKNNTDKEIYKYIETNGFITVHQVLEISRITTTQGANAALGRLMKNGLVEKVQRGKQFIYILKTRD